MDDVWWCGMDMATDIPNLHTALGDPLWSPFFADCGASSIGSAAHACFGVADFVDMDAVGFFGGEDGRQLALQHDLMLSSASVSSSLSLDSGGSSGSYHALDTALAAAATTNSHASQLLVPAAPVAPDQPLTNDYDEALMRTMMEVMSSSSASPSSSASASASSPQFCREEGTQPRGGDCHVMVQRSSLTVSSPEKMGGQQELRSTATASQNGGKQLYHVMSERKRREKLNDSFQTLRSLLPPCSKKDKTTVLSNAASHLRTLEVQVSDLEEKNGKLEKHIHCDDGSSSIHQRSQQQRAKVRISKATAAAAAAATTDDPVVVDLTVMVMVECDVVELVLRVLERLRWMEQISVLSVDADAYSPQVLLKAIASIKLRIMDGGWNEASFHEAMTKAVNDAISSPPLAVTA